MIPAPVPQCAAPSPASDPTIRNNVAGTNAVSVLADAASVVNSTLISGGSGSDAALFVGAPTNQAASATVRNTIMDGPTDIRLQPTGPSGSARATVDHSAYVTTDLSGTGGAGNGELDSVAGNLGEASFVNAATGDYQQAAGSVTVNAGTLEGYTLPGVGTDLGGLPRVFGSSVDIGAFEHPEAPTLAGTGVAGSITSSSAVLNAFVNTNTFGPATVRFDLGTTLAYGQSVDASGPVGNAPVPASATATGLAPETTYHYRVVVTTAGGTLSGADQTFTTAAAPPPSPPQPPPPPPAPAPADTTASSVRSATLGSRTLTSRESASIRFSLSEAGTVRVAVERASSGKRRGKACVRPTKTLRRAKTCNRYTRVEAFSAKGKKGANSVPLTKARIRALGPGAYRLVLTVQDAAKNVSRQTTLAFRIRR